MEDAACECVPATLPAVWGPPTWQTLHYFAAGYPARPTPPVRQHCQAFLRALPWLLPCDSCGYHLRRFLQAYPGGAAEASSSGAALARFFVALHNEVARHTRPAARPWSLERATAHYASAPRPCTSARHWGGAGHLIREAPEASARADVAPHAGAPSEELREEEEQHQG